MNGVAVIIPWQHSCPYRDLNIGWVWREWEDAGYDVHLGLLERGEPWCKAKAVAAGLKLTDAETLVIADSDVWCDVKPAVDAVQGGAPHAIPHISIHRMDPLATSRVLQGGELMGPLMQRAYRGVLGGGITVINRNTYKDIPLDPAFIGWGQEDESWGIALRALAGKGFNGQEKLWHLWHPPMERKTRGTGSPESKARRDLYLRNVRHPEVLWQLVKGTPIQEIVAV